MRPVRESVSLHETRNAECDICGALLGDAEKHAEWHEEQADVARNANLGAMSMRPIGGGGFR